MKRLLLVGLLVSIVAIFALPISMVSSQEPITPYETTMSINCTWTLNTWTDSNALPPLPGSGWAVSIFSLTVDQPMQVNLYITDRLLKGDYFEVYEVDGLAPTQATLIGTTPIVPVNGSGTLDNPDLNFIDPSYSHSMFRLSLSTGTHYFAFREVGHNWGDGGFYVKFCTLLSVGGFVEPANSFAILAPYLAFIVAMLTASTLIALKIRYKY